MKDQVIEVLERYFEELEKYHKEYQKKYQDKRPGVHCFRYTRDCSEERIKDTKKLWNVKEQKLHIKRLIKLIKEEE